MKTAAALRRARWRRQRTKQSKCPAPKELLKQRIEYKLCSNDDDVMEWHGGVVKKKYKTKPGWYSCALDDGTAVVLLFENSNRDNVWRIVKPAAQPAAKPMIAFATAPSSPRASPSAAAKPSGVPAFDCQSRWGWWARALRATTSMPSR